MTYKDTEKQKQYQREWYQRNKSRMVAKQRKLRANKREAVYALKDKCCQCGEDDRICLDFHHVESWCRVKEKKYDGADQAIKNEVIFKRIMREVNDINAGLDQTEQIKKIVLLNDEWSVDNNLLSPTLKLKRKYLVEKYRDLIEGIYENAK